MWVADGVRQRTSLLLRVLLLPHSQAVVRVLLEAGANRNRTDKFGISALAEAVKGGHESIIDLLLSHKAE